MESLYSALQRTVNPSTFGSAMLNGITPEQIAMFDTKNFLPSGLNQTGITNSASNYFDNLGKLPTATDGLKDTNWGNTPFSSKLGLGLGAVSGALDAIGAHRAYSLGKRQLTAQTDQFNRQFAAQRGLVNSQLADRQDWRNRNMPNQYLSTADYMAKYGVK